MSDCSFCGTFFFFLFKKEKKKKVTKSILKMQKHTPYSIEKNMVKKKNVTRVGIHNEGEEKILRTDVVV